MNDAHTSINFYCKSTDFYINVKQLGSSYDEYL